MYVHLVKSFSFEAAHFLPSFPDGHKCRRMHGHSFKVDVVVAGEIPDGQYHLMDYGDVKKAFAPIEKQLDHYCLNEIDGLANPTSEVIAQWIWARLAPELPLLHEIIVHETCTSRCSYFGPDGKERRA